MSDRMIPICPVRYCRQPTAAHWLLNHEWCPTHGFVSWLPDALEAKRDKVKPYSIHLRIEQAANDALLHIKLMARAARRDLGLEA